SIFPEILHTFGNGSRERCRVPEKFFNQTSDSTSDQLEVERGLAPAAFAHAHTQLNHDQGLQSIFSIVNSGVPWRSCGPSSVRTKPRRSYSAIARLRYGVVLRNRRLHSCEDANCSTLSMSSSPIRCPLAAGSAAMPRT